MIWKNLYKYFKIPAHFSKKFALGQKFADYEAICDATDNQKLTYFENFQVFLYCSKPTDNCSIFYHFDR